MALGSALFVVTQEFLTSFHDSTRIAAQVVSGIGFLGAGVILREGLTIRGLTTAATLWCSAAIGTLAGFGLLLEATIGTAAILCVTLIFLPLDLWISRKSRGIVQPSAFVLRITCLAQQEEGIRNYLIQATKDSPLLLQKLASEQTIAPDKKAITATLLGTTAHVFQIEKMITHLNQNEKITDASWESSTVHD